MSLPRSVVFYCMGDLGAPHPLIGSRKRFGTATQNAHEISFMQGDFSSPFEKRSDKKPDKKTKNLHPGKFCAIMEDDNEK